MNASGLASLPVSVLVVSWNSRAVLPACLDALGATPEIIVVDNASSDGSAALVRERYPDVRLREETVNRGFAGAVNRAARLATRKFFLLLNPDTQVEPGAIATLARRLEGDPRVAAVAGHLVDAAGASQQGFTVRRFPTLGSIASDLLLLDELWPGNPWRRAYHALDLDLSRDQPVEQPAAACLMVRREVFERLGGLDERFHPAWFEDVDFCRRLARDGGIILFVSDARVRHEGGASVEHLGRAAFSTAFYRNLVRYVSKHQGPAAAALVRSLIVAGMMLRIGASAARGAGEDVRAFARVLGEALTPASRSSSP